VVVSKRYRPWTPMQPYLLPPSPTEWLPSGHLAYFILELVDELDLGAIERALLAKDARGERPYAPRMMVALLLYGYCIGVFSSRRIARATYEDVAFRVLAGESHPYFTTINEFRLVHGPALGDLFVQGLRLCQRAGLVKLGHVSVDGTKILANASKHKAMSYQRMQREEARLRAEVEALLRRADEADQAEDDQFGVGRDPWLEVPEELQRRESRIERIRAAKAELEREAAEERAAQLRENARGQEEKASNSSIDPVERRRAMTRAAKSRSQAHDLDGRDDDDLDGGNGSDLPRHHTPAKPDGTPTPTAQRNFTDADSRIMPKHGGWVQAFNAQIAVDGASQIIVAQAVTNQSPDTEHLVPMLDRAQENTGRYPECLSADSGYYSDLNVTACEQRKIDAYISVGRATHSGEQTFNAVAHRGPVRDRMQAKLASHIGHAMYSRRKAIAEPPFGQIQAARGFRRFSVRGLAKTRWEWAMVCLTHNLLKLFRLAWRPTARPSAA
jgi:transposase